MHPVYARLITEATLITVDLQSERLAAARRYSQWSGRQDFKGLHLVLAAVAAAPAPAPFEDTETPRLGLGTVIEWVFVPGQERKPLNGSGQVIASVEEGNLRHVDVGVEPDGEC